MNTPMIDLKTEVMKAIDDAWPSFSTSHPHLAAVLDETLLLDEAVQSIRGDPEFQQAMTAAESQEAMTQNVTDFIQTYVVRWLRRFV